VIAEVQQFTDYPTQAIYRANIADLFAEFLPLMTPRERVALLDFLERVFHYPSGPRKGQRFCRTHQPATSAFLELLDRPQWRRANLIAVNQSGKSLSLLAWLTSNLANGIGEDCGISLPTLDVTWRQKIVDLKTIFDASLELKALWPSKGAGSKGGVSPQLQFGNGRRLHAFGMNSNQEARSAATVRCMGITEAKKADDISAGDEGTTVYAQLENRTRAYQGRQLVFSESTLTTPENITWRLWLEGTGTLPHFPCESCETHICPDMEHLIGWQDCRNENEVREKTRFVCPSCGWFIPPEKRRAALQEIIALHRGQSVERGRVLGPAPTSSTLSYRVTASTNMFADEGELGVALWRLHATQDKVARANLERTIRQGLFALPAKDSKHIIDELDGMRLMTRLAGIPRGTVPEGTTELIAGIDTRKTVLHFAVVAFRENAGPIVADWGSQPIQEGRLWDDALLEAAAVLQKRFERGYPMHGGGTKTIDFESWDAGWRTQQVQAVCDSSDFSFPSMGFGAGILQKTKYRRRAGAKIVGLDWQIVTVADRDLLEIDASAWKSRLLARLDWMPTIRTR